MGIDIWCDTYTGVAGAIAGVFGMHALAQQICQVCVPQGDRAEPDPFGNPREGFLEIARASRLAIDRAPKHEGLGILAQAEHDPTLPRLDLMRPQDLNGSVREGDGPFFHVLSWVN